MNNISTILASDVIEIPKNNVEILTTTFQLKRGISTKWAKNNPLLEQGEPGFAYDTNELKIGDGIRHWNDLPLITGEIIIPPTASNNLVIVESLPQQGANDLIYKVNGTQKIYIWNNITNEYQEIGEKQEQLQDWADAEDC